MDFELLEMEMIIKALREDVLKLSKEIKDYKKVLEEYDLLEQVGIERNIGESEQICIDGISHLAKLFESGNFDNNDVKNFDLLQKNLRMIKGNYTEDKKSKTKFDPKEALRIVEGFKADDGS